MPTLAYDCESCHYSSFFLLDALETIVGRGFIHPVRVYFSIKTSGLVRSSSRSYAFVFNEAFDKSNSGSMDYHTCCDVCICGVLFVMNKRLRFMGHVCVAVQLRHRAQGQRLMQVQFSASMWKRALCWFLLHRLVAGGGGVSLGGSEGEGDTRSEGGGVCVCEGVLFSNLSRLSQTLMLLLSANWH